MQYFNPTPNVSVKLAPILGVIQYSPSIAPADVAAELVIETHFILTQFNP